MTDSNNMNMKAISLQQTLQGRSLADLVQQTESEIRQEPGDATKRWLLFELLCIFGEWPRALKQLEVCMQMQPEKMAERVQIYHALIDCEQTRKECFSGKRQPGSILPLPTWTQQMIDAIALNSRGEEAAADELRETALNAASEVPGESNFGAFEWISDSDTWIGPVCEVAIGGSYVWLPFAQMASLKMTAPTSLLDFLWNPAILTLSNQSVMRCFVFSRYSGSETESDQIRLCRETVWRENGRTSIRALGQKTWQTSAGDLSVLDLRTCEFTCAPDAIETVEAASA